MKYKGGQKNEKERTEREKGEGECLVSNFNTRFNLFTHTHKHTNRPIYTDIRSSEYLWFCFNREKRPRFWIYAS